MDIVLSCKYSNKLTFMSIFQISEEIDLFVKIDRMYTAKLQIGGKKNGPL